MLRAAAEALLDGQAADPARYDQVFVADPALYQQFARAADRTSRSVSGQCFADATLAVRREVLAHIARTSQVRAWALTGQRQRWRHEEAVVVPVLARFARTDGLVAVGYSQWPGAPRDLPQGVS